MSENHTLASEKFSEMARMSGAETYVDRFQRPVREIVAREYESRRNIDAAITAAARHSGLPRSRVRACWYGEVRQVLAAEMDLIRERYRAWIQHRRMALETEIARLDQEWKDLGGDDE